MVKYIYKVHRHSMNSDNTAQEVKSSNRHYVKIGEKLTHLRALDKTNQIKMQKKGEVVCTILSFPSFPYSYALA